MIDLSWDPDYLHFIIVILWSAVGFGGYYFLAKSSLVTQQIWKANPSLDLLVKKVVLQRIWGFLFLGIAPAVIILLVFKDDIQNFGLGFSFLNSPPWWVLLLLGIIVVAGYFNASKPGNLVLYPQIRIKRWSHSILALSGASWVLFLVGYEFFFRGFLLFATLQIMAPWAAIALNCSLYAFAHFYKGPGETFGAIPLGILLCYLTVLTGNIWTAVIIHSVMALSNEWWSIRANSEIKVVRGK